MAIIVVGGSGPGAGKTALVCGLIAALPEFRWTAVKIESQDQDAAVTTASGRPAAIKEETLVGASPDTARYLAAGAARAFLATPPGPHSEQPHLVALLDELWPNFGRGTNLIFESNSVVHHVSPNACLMVHAVSPRQLPLPERQPSFFAALNHADAVVAPAPRDSVTQDGLRLAGQEPKPIFLLAALERVSPELLAWIRPRLGSAR